MDAVRIPTQKSCSRSTSLYLALLFTLSGILSASACQAPSAARVDEDAEAAEIEVSTMQVSSRDVPVQIDAIGHVQASSIVSVKPQVDGIISQVHFREGRRVDAGDLLFTLDRRPFQERVHQARARLEKDLAAVEVARAQLEESLARARQANLDRERYAELLEAGAVAREEYDRLHTNAEVMNAAVEAARAAVKDAEALVRSDQAVLQGAEIDLEYTEIHSPLNGITGQLLVHAGNVVKQNETDLVRINRIRPAYVAFSVPEQYLDSIRKQQQRGNLEVAASESEQFANPVLGTLSFIDNQVSPETGTIELKADFANSSDRLWSGRFVHVRLTLTIRRDAVLIPTPAVQEGQNGKFAFVVRPDMTVELRPLELGLPFEQHMIVEKGVESGETVIVDGQLDVKEGMKVRSRPVD